MAVVKWIFVVLFGLGGLGALGLGFVEGGVSRTPTLATVMPVALRPFPAGAVSAAAKPEAKPAAPTPDAAPAEVAKAEPEPAKPPEAAKAEPAKPPEPAKAEAAKPEPAKPEVAKAEAPKPEPKAEAAKPPEPKPAPVAAPPAEGMLNLRASDTADVYLDGKKLGGSPLLGVKAKVGNHKVRFDCYDAAGNTVTGAVQTVAVKPDAETEVDFTCPAE